MRLSSRAPGLETFPLQDGATGFLPPELPTVGEAAGQRIYWMSELLGDNWQPLPDARLASRVVHWPSYDSASARPTRSGADELAGRLRCARCREHFALTDRGWQPEAEPQWRYRLNELLWQLLMHNGDVPLRALRETLGIGTADRRQPTASLHEHDLWEPGAETPIELDICAQCGPELWIGEAKVADSLGREQQARAKLEGLRKAAKLLRPHGILLVTASEGWTDRTKEIARDMLADMPSELRFARCPRPA